MEAGAHLHDRASLRAHRTALNAFQGAATGICHSTTGALEQAIADVQRSVEHWTGRRAEAQREAAAASSALSACRADPKANCSAEADALDQARALLAKAEENLATARRCQGQASAAATRFRRELSIYRSHLDRELTAAVAFLGGLSTAADAYAGSSVSAGSAPSGMGLQGPVGGGSSGGGGSGGNLSGSLPRIGQTDMAEAPLDRIDLTHSTVAGPESFKKADYATMREGTQRLDEVVLPAVRGGADGEHFARMDAERGLDYEHGYQRVYDAFFGDDSLRLDAREDGSFGVTSGYHRIHVALELGLRKLPARISFPRRRS